MSGEGKSAAPIIRDKRLILASGSPRRLEILRHLGVRLLQVDPPEGVEEKLQPGAPVECACSNARVKVDGWWNSVGRKWNDPEGLDAIALGVDTVVACDGKVLGKPSNREEAREHIRLLAGREHRVVSGLALLDTSTGICSIDHGVTKVRFRHIGEDEIVWYLDRSQWMDKAGSYGIQDEAGLFVEEIQGCYFNVVGLPLATLVGLFTRMGLSWQSFIGAGSRDERGDKAGSSRQ